MTSTKIIGVRREDGWQRRGFARVVAFEVDYFRLEVKAQALGVMAETLDEGRVAIDGGDVEAGAGEQQRVTAGAAGHVEHAAAAR